MEDKVIISQKKMEKKSTTRGNTARKKTIRHKLAKWK